LRNADERMVVNVDFVYGKVMEQADLLARMKFGDRGVVRARCSG
jgi:hypothetical protein